MSSFVLPYNNIVTTLQNNSALSTFCNDKWGKALTVKKVYKKRIEINLDELPIILVTRPSVEKEFLIGARDADHIVRLYCGFNQADREKAQEEIVEFEEKIDDALMVDHTRDGTATNTNPKSSVNDEGENHPSYFILMDVAIKHRR